MEKTTQGLQDRMLDLLDPVRAGRFLVRPGTRYALSWVLALAFAAVAITYAWKWGDKPRRQDGNDGHVNIDFGGQYLLGRMVVGGFGPHLYERAYQRRALTTAYPEDDAEDLFGATVAEDAPGDGPALGGPLYPPVHALLFAPLGLLPPQPAYRVVQVANLVLIFLAGWLVERLAGGRVWWPLATALLMVFPGFAGAINLGQNPVLSLVLLLLGWLLLSRGRPAAGGVLWGLLAFKPVWAVSFFLVPLLTRRWRFAGAMLVTGTLLAVATLPVVGLHSWLDWLAVGRLASREYGQVENWIFVGRDLLNVPRRWLLHFEDGRATDPDRPLPAVLGLVLWLAVAAVTVVVALWRGRRPAPPAGPAAAFVLLGAWLSCYHFMYYDTLLAALPVALLFTEPRRYLDVCFCGRAGQPLSAELMAYYRPRPEGLLPPPLPLLPGGRQARWVCNALPPTVLVLLIGLPYLCALLDPTHHYPPFDTFCLLVLWAWCGWTGYQPPDHAGHSSPRRGP